MAETSLLAIVPFATSLHLRGQKSAIFFESPSWIGSSQINDGVSKPFPLFGGHFFTQGEIIVLLGISPIVEISGS